MKVINIIISMVFLGFGTRLAAQESELWTLEECIAYALEQNIQVRKSELSTQSLEYSSEQAKAQRFPTLNASVNQNFNWNRVTGESGFSGNNGSSYSVNSGVTIFNGFSVSNQIRQAALSVESGKLSTETTKESVSLEILNAFLSVLYAEEQVNNSEEQVAATTEQLRLAEERLTLEAISQSDYLNVKSQLASEKLTLANARSQLAIARVNLMQLMELPVTDDFSIAHPDLQVTLNEERDPDVQKIYQTALAIKPQIKNAEINKESAALDEKIAKASYFPSLTASAGISTNFSGSNTTPYFDQLDNGLSPALGLSLSIPIYQRQQAKTNVSIAKINYQTAELSEIDTKNQLRKSIEQACQDVVSAQIEFEASEESYQATEASFAIAQEKFNQGLINSVDYTVEKTNLIVAESNLLQSKYNLIFSYKILDFYQGIPLTL